MIEYKIIITDSTEDMNKMINAMLAEGWSMCSGITVALSPYDGTMKIGQSMLKMKALYDRSMKDDQPSK